MAMSKWIASRLEERSMDIRPIRGGMEDGAAPPGLLTESPLRSLDHAKEAWIARATGGLSPAALALAFSYWFMHLLAAPGKQLELASLAMLQAREFAEAACGV